ncbi:MAG: hypothetical protein ACOH2H_02545 [Cypionkella sp.]
MGSAHPTRLSFLRALLRRMMTEGWRFDRPVWEIDAKGVGRAVYRAVGSERTYSLVAFAHDLPDDMRSDRVIATAWDATFALFDGTPNAADLDRLAANVPLQEAGRVSAKELTLSRANRSVRLFQHVVDRLSAGQQPDAAELDAVGYLMRTTAVYGSGKFGAADRAVIADRPELSGPFRAEMLTVWLIRAFTVDLVEHIAATRGGTNAVRLDPDLRKRLGVGNSTGLGMAPFVIRHPILLNNWMQAREEALARVRAQTSAAPEAVEGLRAALTAAQENAATWHSDHPVQQAKLADLRRDLTRIAAELDGFSTGEKPWNRLWLWAEVTLSLEGQEALLAMMLEPHGDLIDDLAETMSADETATFTLDGSVRVADFRTGMAARYGWALARDYSSPEDIARFWYVSEEKLEPRIGDRFAEDGAALEQPLGIGRLALDLARDLADWPGDQPLASFLLAHPEHRLMVRRVQQSTSSPYAEIQDNLLAADMLPIDILRCKLAFFGASHFDPRSDKWVRISLYKGEPYPEDLNATKDTRR